MADSNNYGEFQAKMNVSRETIDRLVVLETLLRKWNPSINLVGKSTLADMWSRHFLDSAQIFEISKFKQGLWVDIGSGGGFPGLVVAAMAVDMAPDLRFVLVESDLRKATFLREAVREMQLSVTVLSERAEDIEALGANVFSARALAPLPRLLAHAHRHLNSHGQAILLKGANFRRELTESLEKWTFQSDEYPSKTKKGAVILSIGDISSV